MLWFTRAASWAAVINVLATALAFYLPSLAGGWRRAGFISVIIVVIRRHQYQRHPAEQPGAERADCREAAAASCLHRGRDLLVDPALLVPQRFSVACRALSDRPAAHLRFRRLRGHSRSGGRGSRSRRAVPFALITTILIVTIVMTLVQVVALGTLPGLAASRTPLADAAMLFMGGTGAALLTLGAVLSTTGNNVGQALSGSRNLFALAEQGDLPRFFGWVHPQFRTPVNAILVTSAVSLVLAVSGTLLGPRARQRDQPPARLRRDLRVDDSIALAGVCRTRQPGDVCRAVRAGNPRRRHRPRSVDDRRARRERLIAGLIALIVGGFLYVIAVRRACRCRIEALATRASRRRHGGNEFTTKKRRRTETHGRGLAGAQAVAA